MTAHPSTKSVASETRTTKTARAHNQPRNPVTGKPMSAAETTAIHDMLDTITRRASRQDPEFMWMLEEHKRAKRREERLLGKKVAKQIDAAFVIGVHLGGRSVGRKWVKVSTSSALAYAMTGQDDEVGPSSLTLSTPGRKPAKSSAPKPPPLAKDGVERWSPNFETKPSWEVGHPFIGVTQIEHDVRTAKDWAWLTEQVRQLQALYEARTGRALPVREPWWEDQLDD